MVSRQKILITGANGLLGRHATESFSSSHEVHALVRQPPADPLANVIYHSVDLAGEWREQDLPTGIDTILHLVQSSHFREFPEQAIDIFRVNIESTARLLDFARRGDVKRFVYASSGGVYGFGAGAFSESSPVKHGGQLGYYIGSKLCGEILAGNYARHMHVDILRFFFIYGRAQKRSMLLPRLVDNVRDGKSITLQGRDGIRVNPVHVSDATKALRVVLDFDGNRTFNVAGTEILSLRAIAEKIGVIVGRAPIFVESDGVAGDVVADIQSVCDAGWSPTVTLDAGLRDLI